MNSLMVMVALAEVEHRAAMLALDEANKHAAATHEALSAARVRLCSSQASEMEVVRDKVAKLACAEPVTPECPRASHGAFYDYTLAAAEAGEKI